jgi:Flp pilus assembly protein TadD
MEENKQQHKIKVSSAESEGELLPAEISNDESTGEPNKSVSTAVIDDALLQFGPYELRPSPTAIFRLSLGTSAAIATALAIPDAFSLLPSAPSILVWAVRLAGLWMYAYLLWSVGFLALLHIVRLLGGGVKLDSEGLSLGKFSKKIKWEQIEFVAIEERKAFSRAFCIEARELKVHVRKPDKKVTVKSIASFQFSPEQFFSLFHHICYMSAGVRVNSFGAMVFRDPASKELKKQAEQGRVKRVLLTIIIASSLLIFLGRKSAVNYYFNLGNKQSMMANEQKAAEYYRIATKIDWTFPPAWDRLARSEFRTGNIESARTHWQKALSVKPDYVESKLGLANIYMLEGNIEEADMLISKANRLAEYDEAGYLNRAIIESMKGNNSTAISLLLPFIKQSTGRDLATAYLARFYIKQGEYDLARGLLATPSLANNKQLASFLCAIQAELALAEGRLDDAAKALSLVDMSKVKDPNVQVDFALLNIERKQLSPAQEFLDKASAVNKTSPWIALAKARLCAAKKDEAGMTKQLQYCINWKYIDPALLAACAKLMAETGDAYGAKTLALKALSMDGTNKLARDLSLKPSAENDAEKKKLQSSAGRTEGNLK